MFRIILLVVFAIITSSSFAQGYIHQYKGQVKRQLKKYIAKNNYTNSRIEETDTSLVLQIRETTVRSMDFIYHIAKSNKCDWEKVMADCDSCVEKQLKAALGYKQYEWKQFNSNQYLSKFSKKMLITVSRNTTPHFYIIERIKLNRETYDLMLHPM